MGMGFAPTWLRQVSPPLHCMFICPFLFVCIPILLCFPEQLSHLPYSFWRLRN